MTSSIAESTEKREGVSHREWHILDPKNLAYSLCGRKMPARAPRRRALRSEATCVVCADLAERL